MSRQAYFYRVPPQELHRRNQLQADPAKTRALQTVIEMKVGQTVDQRGNDNVLHGECVYGCFSFSYQLHKFSVFTVYSISCAECVHEFHVKLQHVVQFSLRSTSYQQNVNY